jgi:hypothetical protein
VLDPRREALLIADKRNGRVIDKTSEVRRYDIRVDHIDIVFKGGIPSLRLWGEPHYDPPQPHAGWPRRRRARRGRRSHLGRRYRGLDLRRPDRLVVPSLLHKRSCGRGGLPDLSGTAGALDPEHHTDGRCGRSARLQRDERERASRAGSGPGRLENSYHRSIPPSAARREHYRCDPAINPRSDCGHWPRG